MNRHVVATLCCVLVIPLVAQVKKPKNPLGNGPEVVSAGRALFNKNCTMCHGPDGVEGERGPALGQARRYFRVSDAAIFDAIRNGIQGSAMPSTTLPESDVWRMVAFIRSLRGTASDIDVAGDPVRGQQVFESKGCIKCHMVRGMGGLLGPDLSNIGGERSLTYIRDALVKSSPPRPGFRPVSVITADGRAIEGVVRNEDAFSLQVLDRDLNLHLLVRQELRKILYPETSLMPRGWDTRMSKEEMQDLLAWLSRQARDKVRLAQQGENEPGR